MLAELTIVDVGVIAERQHYVPCDGWKLRGLDGIHDAPPVWLLIGHLSDRQRERRPRV